MSMENVITKYLKKLFETKWIWEENDKQNLGNVLNINKGKKSREKSYQHLNLKEDHHTGDKWLIHGPRHHKENQLLSLEHPCWLCLV